MCLCEEAGLGAMFLRCHVQGRSGNAMHFGMCACPVKSRHQSCNAERGHYVTSHGACLNNPALAANYFSPLISTSSISRRLNVLQCICHHVRGPCHQHHWIRLPIMASCPLAVWPS